MVGVPKVTGLLGDEAIIGALVAEFAAMDKTGDDRSDLLHEALLCDLDLNDRADRLWEQAVDTYEEAKALTGVAARVAILAELDADAAPTDSESPDVPHNPDVWELRYRLARTQGLIRALLNDLLGWPAPVRVAGVNLNDLAAAKAGATSPGGDEALFVCGGHEFHSGEAVWFEAADPGGRLLLSDLRARGVTRINALPVPVDQLAGLIKDAAEARIRRMSALAAARGLPARPVMTQKAVEVEPTKGWADTEIPY